MKKSFKVEALLLGVVLGCSWANVSVAAGENTGETGETPASCGAKTDSQSKDLSEDTSESAAPSQKGGKSSSGSADMNQQEKQ